MTTTPSTRAPRLLVIAGSARIGSLNRQLADLAARRAQALGAETTVVDLRSLELPVYDEDWAQAHGKPAGARRLRDLFAEHDGLILASPEYNALPTPLLINSFDWLPRGASPSACWRPRPVRWVASVPCPSCETT